MEDNLQKITIQKRWNEIVIEQNGSPLHSFEWAKMKEFSGSEVCLCFVDNDYLACAIPIYVKTYLGMRIGWIPDGVLYNGDIELFYKHFSEIFKQKKLSLILTEFHLFFQKNSIYINKIKIPFKRVSETLIHDLSVIDSDSLTKKYNKTTRKYIKRGEKAGIECSNFNINELPVLYKSYLSMASDKKFNPVISLNSISYLLSLIEDSKHVNKSLKNYSIRTDLKGENLGFLITLSMGSRTLEFLRNDNKSLNSKFSSRILTHNALLNSLKSSTSFYDFGGVEIKKNPGVYNFKASFGGFLSKSTNSIITNIW
jgi:hypothetical protein